MSSGIVHVDTEALTEGTSSFNTSIEEIKQYAQFMVSKINAVNDLFSSNNYDRIIEALQRISSCLDELYSRMESGSAFLKTLSTFVDEYNSKKY